MIKDSGDRTEFESGAVRDMREGKGRCDLLPLDIISEILEVDDSLDIVYDIYLFVEGDSNGVKGWRGHLLTAVERFCKDVRKWDMETMLLEVAIHFEEGAKKYGDNNWRKGIPVRCYIDSALRHYFKYRRGDKDEPHDRAFCWNLLCAAWTCDHMPELNEYDKKTSKESLKKAEEEFERM